jgi:uncharacterized protein (TIGR00299 family) protein
MRTLAFDGRTGASGDMVLGALVAAGADPAVLAPVEDALDVEYAVEGAMENGIAATNVRVLASGADDSDHGPGDHHSHDSNRADENGDDSAREHDHSHGHDHGHSHNRGHDNSHNNGYSRDHGHDHTPTAEGQGPLRTYTEVVDIVEGMDLPDAVVADATAVFETLGEAEAAVHGTDLSETHFHEVGADDAIADVVGAALLLDDLGVDRVLATPVRTGGGTVEMSHGVYPVPAPAVVEIVERAEWAVRGGPVERELLTPTGAAVLAHFAEGVADLPALDVTASGYGAGGYDLGDRPNVLRALVGEEREDASYGVDETVTHADGGEGRLVRDDVAVLETNVDDVAPEVLGSLQETLAEVGARDVTIVPTTMKKSRPGHLVKVIAKPEDAEAVARRLAEETGTLGVREGGATHRWIAERAFETVTLSIGGEEYEVSVKVASDDAGEVYDVSAEYDDALAVARETGLALREVLRRAESAVKE